MLHSKTPVEARRYRLTTARAVLFWFILFAAPVATLELGLRVYFALQLGPSLLFYGTRLNAHSSGDAHSGDMNIQHDYFKYYPHQERFTRDCESGRLIRATINSRGFRGPDFAQHKSPGVIRVVTLGASSTFGFSNRDETTYPHCLEQLLNREAPAGERFEVINLGIPHLKSGQILALFEKEALPLDPDVVTFYEGVNDSWSSPVLFKRESEVSGRQVRDKARKVPLLRQPFQWSRDHFIGITLADAFVKGQRNIKFTATDLDEHLRGKGENFVGNVAAIYDECKRRGIAFIVASQQAKSQLVDRKEIKGITYEDETKLVQRHLAQDKYISHDELSFLTHAVLMSDLKKWSNANNVPYVDVIAATDQQRDCLVSWVHLNPKGNLMVAEAFAKVVLAQVPQRHGVVP